ncbi:MAG: homocysteine S-methyltransferase family protein [Actinobacteria bacterium]|nr:homocysteine S-methyltransferase family protein [Actinomycetota bacterium]
MSLNLRELLEDRILVGDGAMGTLLGERGVGFGHPYARANLSHPEMVAVIHEEYLRAGANVIETNTFSANRYKLEIHDLEDCVRQVNVAGAYLARKAADTVASGEKALVLGAIGPLGRPLAPIGPVSLDEAREVFLEQAEALLEGGADALLLETFTDLAELRLAYEAVRPLDAPVLAYKTFVEDGETLAEGLPERAAREISSWGADLTGSNCTVGPQRMVGIAEQMSAGAGPVAAFPNPGLPQLVGGSVRYNRDVRHFVEYGVKLAEAGARLIGGCCGTTPTHVHALSEALKGFTVDGRATRKRVSVVERPERVRVILAVTGDPAQIGDYPEATSVFDTDSVGLIHVLSRMNAGEDLAGNPVGEPPGFLIGASFNPTADDLGSEVDKLRRKVEAGAHAFWTQPVFEIGALERALEEIDDPSVCILLGLMPLRSARQAEFLHHEVPGINIPEHIRRKLAELPAEDAPKYGVEVAQNLLVKARPLVGGAYIMPPASAPDLAGDVIEGIGLQASGISKNLKPET